MPVNNTVRKVMNYENDLTTAPYVVMLDRYRDGKNIGVNTLAPPPDGFYTRLPYVLHTVGLFTPDKADLLRTYLTFSRNLTCFSVLEIPDDVAAYIGDQVIPLEWKTGYHDGQTDVVDFIQVYA